MNRKMLEKQLLNRILEAIPILIKNKDITNPYGAYNISWRNGVKIVAANYAEMQKLYAPSKFLSGIVKISERYSDEYIDSLVQDCFCQLIKDKGKVHECITNLVAELIETADTEYKVISGLENIELDKGNEYEIFDTLIKVLRKKDLPFYQKSMGKPVTDTINRPAIITVVKVRDFVKAKEIALHRFLISLNLIRLYSPSSALALQGCSRSSIRKLIICHEDCVETSSELIRTGNPVLSRTRLCSGLYDDMVACGISELARENEINKVIKECLYWYGMGLDENYPASKLINFVTVLESVLKKRNENTELRRAVSERGAILLKHDFESRKIAYKELKAIYDTRSRIVHTGALVDDKDLASLAGEYARQILMTIIGNLKTFEGGLEEFIDYLDDGKLGRKILEA